VKKLTYVRQQGLGGVIIWELGGGYRDSQPTGKKDALLQSVKRAWLAPNPVSTQPASPPAKRKVPRHE
jgi:hypothetical protein